MFERKKSQGSTAVPAQPQAPAVRDPQAPKGRPTPTRREREEARKRPLVQERPRGSRGMSGRDQRAYAREQMLSGNEKYLPERDKGPERALLRDAVDSRWNIGEFFLPVLVVVLLLTFVRSPWAQTSMIVIVYGLMLAVVIDSFFSWRRAKRLVKERLHTEPARGSMMYTVMRGLQIRRMRMPLPRVTRGTRI